jgi:hypothetical protein
MRHVTVRSVTGLAALIGLLASAAAAQSVWQKIQKAAQPPGQQQQQQQPGRKPANPGQQPQQGGNQDNTSGPFTPPPGTKIEQAVLAPVQQGMQFSVSPHGIHVVTESRRGSRQVIIYDGVEGPPFEQIFPQDGEHPVVFSPDGNRYAYCGQSGNQWVVVVDGKELMRSSDSVNGQFSYVNCALGFTPNSKHVYFTSYISTDSSHSAGRFVFDGKVGPLGASADMRTYSFSPDGDHFVYLWTQPTPPNSTHTELIVDDKMVPNIGGDPQWSADSKHLYTKRSVPVPRGSSMELLLDGKPIMRADNIRLFVPPVGNMVVAVATRSSPPSVFLVIGGKEVPGSEVPGGYGGIENVVFSPDGKHYAARCKNVNNRQFAFVDGKKELEYSGIGSFIAPGTPSRVIGFTADSSKAVYIASNANAQFLVIGGHESDELMSVTDTVLAPVGNHVATEGMGFLTMDGKTLNLGNDPRSGQAYALTFSPDASHFAFVLRERSSPVLYLDGVAQPAFGVTLQGPMTNQGTRPYIFSPDSKHIAYFCHSSDPAAGNDQGLCVDGKYVRLGAPGLYGNLTFTPDSNHLLWAVIRGAGKFRLFADGKPVMDGVIGGAFSFAGETWQMGANGTLSILVQDDPSLKRISITPSPETSLATLGAGK